MKLVKYLEVDKITKTTVRYSDGVLNLYLTKEEVQFPQHPHNILVTIQSDPSVEQPGPYTASNEAEQGA